MSNQSQTASKDRLEKALQALQTARRLQNERLSLAMAHVNYDGEDVNKDGQSKWDEHEEDKLSENQLPREEVDQKENEDDSYTASILSPQHQQEAIKRVERWLQAHPEAEAVRTQYLTLIERQGNQQQQRSAIAQTGMWLEAHPDAASVREQYLILIGKVGTKQQQEEAIAQTATWLQNHPDAQYVRVQYDTLIRKQESTAVPAVTPSKPLNLRPLLQRVVEQFQLATNSLLPPQELALGWRGGDDKSADLIDIDMHLDGHVLDLRLKGIPREDNKVDIEIQLHPIDDGIPLPQGLKLIALSSSGKVIQEDQVNITKQLLLIKLCGGKFGERFAVKVSLGDASDTKDIVM